MYRSERPDRGTIVYVGGLEPSVKKEEIESEFEQFGKLNRVWVAFNPPGFAFVEFDQKSDAETAVDALHNKTKFGTKLRVEISRGRGRGGRGGGSSRGGGRGGFRSDRGDFRGGRGGSDYGRGNRGGRVGFNPYERDEPLKPYRGGDIGSRFDDFEDRRRSEFGAPRDFGGRDFGAVRNFRDLEEPRGFGAGRDIGERDFPPRDVGGRGFMENRDLDRRDMPEQGYGMGRGSRDFGGRNFGDEVPVNGARGYGDDRNFGGVVRDYAAGQNSLPARDFGGPARDHVGRDFPARDRMDNYGTGRDVGIGRDGARDFNPPRDFSGRPSRVDYDDTDRFGAGGRGGFGDGRAAGYDGARFAGGDGGFGGARDRFRSRSPIGRVRYWS